MSRGILQSTSRKASLPETSAAVVVSPTLLDQPTASSNSASVQIFKRSAAPIEARNAFGEKALAELHEMTTSVVPAASQVRRIAPRFDGLFTRCRKTAVLPENRSVKLSFEALGRFAIKTIPCEFLVSASESKILSGTTIDSWISSNSKEFSKPFAKTAKAISIGERIASRASLNPSIKTKSVSRPSRMSRICLSFGLSRLVISIIGNGRH